MGGIEWIGLAQDAGKLSSGCTTGGSGVVLSSIKTNKQNKLHGLSPRANYTDRATAACPRSDCQLLRIKGATWSECRIPTAVFSVF
jgi:hypothetical protein